MPSASQAPHLYAWTGDCMHLRAGVLLQGVKDPEAKRKAIGAEFIRVFQEFADNFKKEHGVSPKCALTCSCYCSSPECGA